MSLEFMQVFYLSSIGDLEDLIPFTPSEPGEEDFKKNCNAYIRLDGNQLFTSQATHNRYPFLLRTFKYYNFPR